MDILIAIFLFIIGFVLTVIGIPKTEQEMSYKTTFFMGIGGFIFILIALMMFVSPIETISGLSTVENVTSTNITEIRTDITFTEIDRTFNNTFAILLAAVGLFVMFFAALTFPRG